VNHTCHAHGCGLPVPPRMFMCRTHWASLRKGTQDAIWREYRPGQEDDKHPSLRYLAVQRFAVAEVAFKPNDAEASRIAASYLVEAFRYSLSAIAAGNGDPLETLVASAEGS
jgi:hypothetical protein